MISQQGKIFMNYLIKKIKQSSILLVVGMLFFLPSAQVFADQDLISLFPLEHYDQTISAWINKNDLDFDAPLLTMDMQQKRLAILQDHYFGQVSPWSADYISALLQSSAPNDLKTTEQEILHYFSNEGKSANQIGYGENFRPYDNQWINKLEANMNLQQLDGLIYQSQQRGIAIENLHARALPTEDVHFYSYKLAGEGYPFDNLQMSALWVGTPVYIIGETKDHAWSLVVTPDYIAWVKSNGIARTDSAFVKTWAQTAKNHLAAITRTETSLTDKNGNFLYLTFVGSLFPAYSSNNDLQLLVPDKDRNHHAIIKMATVNSNDAVLLPLSATPHHFADIMSTLIGRTYGWGSMYLYNDCSAELKSILTPFGIWLPRHSSDQVTVGKMVDMSAGTAEERLAYLMQHGLRFITLIYIGGHVVMYIGNYTNSYANSSLMAMTYQNIWGLSPSPADRRAVIGKSVLFPMLLQYPEDPSLVSLAGKKYFQVSFLNQLPDDNKLTKVINIRSLAFPGDFQ